MINKFYRGALGLSLLLFVASASADTFTFFKITNNNPEDLSAQLSVNVTDAGGGLVSFEFLNNVGIASSVTQIYFDNGSGSFLSALALGTQTGVDFSIGGSPPNLPAGNTVSFTADYLATADSPVAPNGINSATDSLQLLGTGTLANIIAGLTSGDLRIGLHVQAIGQLGGSDSYVTGGTPSAVPVPMSAWLFASGLGFFAIARRRLVK